MICLLACFGLVTEAPAATRQELAATPPMGFNGFYMLGFDINEGLIRGMVEYLYTNKLYEFGYSYVVIDEGWTYLYGDPRGRDANGEIVPDPARFPDLPGLIDYIHSKGLRAGIYTEDTVKEANGFIGSGGHLQQDAATYARWGIDFVKFDVYSADYLAPLAEFAAALDATGRPMILYAGVNGYAHQGGDPRVLDFANCYRFVGDVNCMYEKFRTAVFYGSVIPDAVGPGRWVDYDMLVWIARPASQAPKWPGRVWECT